MRELGEEVVEDTGQSLTISLPIIIRPCQRQDLHDLEWFGALSRYRNLIANTFERHEKGQVIMLVAEANHFPIGQVWVNLEKKRADSIGILYALRVLAPLQNAGIGTRLIGAAESLLLERGYRTAEIGVEKDNPPAKRLYERLGYQVIRENLEEWEVLTPDGQLLKESADEWILQKNLT